MCDSNFRRQKLAQHRKSLPIASGLSSDCSRNYHSATVFMFIIDMHYVMMALLFDDFS